MNRFRNAFYVFGTFLLLFGLVSLLSSSPSYSQGGTQNVRVVNTSTSPVPTLAQGTTTVSGVVQSEQNGNWIVGIAGTPVVSALQNGIWNVGITNTPNVNVTNTPTVALSSSANTVQAQQNGPWAVGISGTPTVSLTPGASVNINGTPTVSVASGTTVGINSSAANPVFVQNVGGSGSQTALVFDSGSVAIPNVAGMTTLGAIDVSSYSQIRVVAGSNCGFSNMSPNSLAVHLITLEGGQPITTVESITPCQRPFSRIIDFPGMMLRVSIFQEGQFDVQQTVRVVIYGR